MNTENNLDEVITNTDNKINITANNLEIDCITNANNKFSLDSDGNLIVNSITTNTNNTIIDFDSIYPIGSIYLSVNNTNPSTLFGGTWELATKNVIDTDWQNFIYYNSDFSEDSYTQNKWRVKDNILYVHIGAGSVNKIDTSTETLIARIPIKNNTSYDNSYKRVWNGAVGGAGGVAGFFIRQEPNYLVVCLKPHSSANFPTTYWYSTHFSIPLDQNFEFTSGSYATKYVWKKIA